MRGADGDRRHGGDRNTCARWSECTDSEEDHMPGRTRTTHFDPANCPVSSHRTGLNLKPFFHFPRTRARDMSEWSEPVQPECERKTVPGPRDFRDLLGYTGTGVSGLPAAWKAPAALGYDGDRMALGQMPGTEGTRRGVARHGRDPGDLRLLSRQRRRTGGRRPDRRRGPGGAVHPDQARPGVSRRGDPLLSASRRGSRRTTWTTSPSTTSR